MPQEVPPTNYKDSKQPGDWRRNRNNNYRIWQPTDNSPQKKVDETERSKDKKLY